MKNQNQSKQSLGHRQSTSSRKPVHISWTEALLGHMWFLIASWSKRHWANLLCQSVVCRSGSCWGLKDLGQPGPASVEQRPVCWNLLHCASATLTDWSLDWSFGFKNLPLISWAIYIQYVVLFICLFVKAGATDVSWQAADIISTQLRPGAFTQVFVQF